MPNYVSATSVVGSTFEPHENLALPSVKLYNPSSFELVAKSEVNKSSFIPLQLQDRMGHSVSVSVYHPVNSSCVFVESISAPEERRMQKNMVFFARQLVDRFALNTQSFCLVEVCGSSSLRLRRWTIHWAGRVALEASVEEVQRPSRIQYFLSLLARH